MRDLDTYMTGMYKVTATQNLIDLAVEENIPPDRLFDQWDETSDWQIDSLIALGMKPRHSLLDIGCGPGRLAVKAVPYLDDGKYFGLDPYPPYVRMGKKILEKVATGKQFQLLESPASSLKKLNVKFDYAMAASVFTHMPVDEISLCLSSLKSVMRPTGKFLFTYVDRPVKRGILYGGIHPMYYDKLAANDFALLAEKLGVIFERWDIPHPTGQHTGIYTF